MLFHRLQYLLGRETRPLRNRFYEMSFEKQAMDNDTILSAITKLISPPGLCVWLRGAVRPRQGYWVVITLTRIRLHSVAEIKLGQILPVRKAAQPPTIPIASQV
jgi:hypothetical protein